MKHDHLESDLTSGLPHLSQRMAGAVSSTGIGALATLFLSALSNIAIARGGGPQQYAVFVAANMIVFLATHLGLFGVPWTLTKLAATAQETHQPTRLRRGVATGVVIALILGGIIGTLLAINLTQLSKALDIHFAHSLAFWLPLALVSAMIAENVGSIYFGLLRTERTYAIGITGQIALIAFVLLRREVTQWPVWGAVIISALSSGGLALFFVSRDKLWGRPLPVGELRALLQDIPTSAGLTLYTIFATWVDRWAVGLMLGGANLGFYSAAVSLFQIALRVPSNISKLSHPITLKSTQTAGGQTPNASNSQPLHWMETMTEGFGLCAALVAVMIWLAAPELVTLVYGVGFAESAPLLRLLTPSLLAAALVVPGMLALAGSPGSRWLTPLLLTSVAVRLMLLPTATHLWGLPGVALATVASDLFHALGYAWVARRTGLPLPLRALVKPLALSALAYAIGWFIMRLGLPAMPSALIAITVFAAQVRSLARLLRGQSRAA